MEYNFLELVRLPDKNYGLVISNSEGDKIYSVAEHIGKNVFTNFGQQCKESELRTLTESESEEFFKSLEKQQDICIYEKPMFCRLWFYLQA